MDSRSTIRFLVALPGAAALGFASGYAAFFVGLATGSEAAALLVTVGLPAAGTRHLFGDLPRGRLVATAAVAVAAAAVTLFVGVSDYSS